MENLEEQTKNDVKQKKKLKQKCQSMKVKIQKEDYRKKDQNNQKVTSKFEIHQLEKYKYTKKNKTKKNKIQDSNEKTSKFFVPLWKLAPCASEVPMPNFIKNELIQQSIQFLL